MTQTVTPPMQNKSNDLETNESNRLIAESPFSQQYIREDIETYKESGDTVAMSRLCTDLKYHESWEWLMPVVEKIEAMGVNIRIEGTLCLIRGGGYGAKGYDEDTKLKSTYAAVVAFITWYNTQNK